MSSRAPDSATDAAAATAAGLPRLAISRTTLAVLACQAAIVVLFLGTWQMASGPLIKPLWISSPTEIFALLVEWIGDGSLWPHVLVTLSEIVIGFLIGAACGIAVGIVLGSLPTVEHILSPLIVGLYAMPKVALAPLFILLFGIDLESKIALVVVTVFFLVLLNTISGMRSVDADLVNSLLVMGASRFDVFRKVTAPSALIWVFNGLRISVRYALTSAVYGEIIASNQGLGFLINRSKSMLDAAGTFAALGVLMLIGLTFTLLVARLGNIAMKWKE